MAITSNEDNKTPIIVLITNVNTFSKVFIMKLSKYISIENNLNIKNNLIKTTW